MRLYGDEHIDQMRAHATVTAIGADMTLTPEQLAEYRAMADQSWKDQLSKAYAEGRADQTDEFAELLPGRPYYMDPPDGGNVSVLEQFRRMSHDARMWREHADRVRKAIECEVQCEGG